MAVPFLLHLPMDFSQPLERRFGAVEIDPYPRYAEAIAFGVIAATIHPRGERGHVPARDVHTEIAPGDAAQDVQRRWWRCMQSLRVE